MKWMLIIIMAVTTQRFSDVEVYQYDSLEECEAAKLDVAEFYRDEAIVECRELNRQIPANETSEEDLIPQ